MAIYQRWGSMLRITANCGQHKPHRKAPGLLTLVEVCYPDAPIQSRIGYQFAETLKADNGRDEIDEAMKAAKHRILEGKALDLALKDAE